MAVRLIFDENLASRLVHVLADLFPGSEHVESTLGRGASDEQIWMRAKANDLLIVTRDEDFQRLSVWRGSPPKVVWIRSGNSSTDEVAKLLRGNRQLTARFVEHEEATILVLG